MQQEHTYRKDSRCACRTSRRQFRKIRARIIVAVLLLSPFIIWGCVAQIDEVSGLDLPELEEVQQAAPSAAEPIQPTAPVYDIPLSPELQAYAYQKSVEYDVDHVMVLAIMQQESEFQANLISSTGDYGLMQINESNLDYLTDALGPTDLLDPKQNIEAGIFWLSGIYQNYSDPNYILMVYHSNGRIVQALIDEGRESTWYSREVLRIMDEIREKQVQI